LRSAKGGALVKKSSLPRYGTTSVC